MEVYILANINYLLLVREKMQNLAAAMSFSRPTTNFGGLLLPKAAFADTKDDLFQKSIDVKNGLFFIFFLLFCRISKTEGHFFSKKKKKRRKMIIKLHFWLTRWLSFKFRILKSNATNLFFTICKMFRVSQSLLYIIYIIFYTIF